jgi:protocatechuate 3,4-dioxygenase, alpha subunit
VQVTELTPSQTVGPFYGYALPFTGSADVAPGHPEAIVLYGQVLDGAGEPVPDALLEFWQAGPDGSRRGAPGSLRRDATSGVIVGRDGVDFTGFGRVATDGSGRYVLRTLPPGGGVPYLCVAVFARGLLHHLYTRAYLTEPPSDPLLASLPPERRATLLTTPERPGVHRFDVRLQYDGQHEETVFFEFR